MTRGEGVHNFYEVFQVREGGGDEVENASFLCYVING